MADQLGSYTAGATVRIKFTTHEAAGPPVAPSSAFEAADLIIYKDGSATQRTSANGITMTSPFDSIVGLHHVDIDLSDNTDAGFYAAGSDYCVVLSPDETVDSIAVLKVLAYFSIERVPKVNVVQNAGTNITSSSGRQEVNVSHVGGSTTPVTNLGIVYNTDFASNYDTTADVWKASVTHNAGTAITSSGGRQEVNVARVDGAVLATHVAGHFPSEVLAWLSSTLTPGVIDTQISTLFNDWANGGRLDLLLDATLADTNELQTDWTNGGRLDLLLDATLADTNELQADWVNGGRLDLIVDAILSDTNAILVDTGTTLDTKLNTIAGYIDTEVAAIISSLSTLTGYVDTEVAAIKTIADKLDTALVLDGAVYQFTANALELAPTGGSAPTVEQIRAEMDSNSTQLAAIVADTNELQADWANNGRLDAILDARASQTSVDTVDDLLDTEVGAIKTVVDAILVDTGTTLDGKLDTIAGYIDTEVSSIVSSLSTITGLLDTEIAAILADTGTDGVVLSTATLNKIADHVRRRTQANVQASSDGDSLSLNSEYGAIQQMQKANTTDTPGTLTVKHPGGTTLGTLTVSTDAAAEPVDGVS